MLKKLFIFTLIFFLFGCTIENNPKKKEVINYYIDNELYLTEDFNGTFKEPTLPPYIGVHTWKEEIVVIDGITNHNYTLTYRPKIFDVCFLDEEENILKKEKVYYGEDATAPTFNENIKVTWDKDYTNVTSDLNVYGLFETLYYNLEFYDGNNKLDLGMNKYIPNTNTLLPTYEKEGFDFLGWVNAKGSLYIESSIDEFDSGDKTYYALFTKTTNSTFNISDADLLIEDVIKLDNNIYQPVIPSSLPQSKLLYTWSTSDKSIATISEYGSISCVNPGYCIVTGILKDTPKKIIKGIIKISENRVEIVSSDVANNRALCTVTFKGFNDEVFKTYRVLEGNSIMYPMPPIVDGYKFVGWDQEKISVDEDTTIYAIYEEGVNLYQGKKFSIMGDSISTYQNYIPASYKAFYPYPTADLFSYNRTWWMKVINNLGSSLFINNSYSGTCVAAKSLYDSQNKERIKESFVNNESPDYMIIFMGANDAASNFSETKFKNGYENMIKNIFEFNKEIKLIVCGLPKSKYYDDAIRTNYNKVIEDLAIKYELTFINFDNIDISHALVDSAHPNHAGMTIISNQILKELNKK